MIIKCKCGHSIKDHIPEKENQRYRYCVAPSFKKNKHRWCKCMSFRKRSNIILLIKKHNDNKTLSKRSTRKNKS